MKKLEYVINKSRRLTFKFTKYLEDERRFIEETIGKYLESAGQINIANQLCYCLHEQASNACKANSKRIYFFEKKLDINNSSDYKVGINTFKESITTRKSHYLALREKHDLYIKFQIKMDQDYLYISIINNVPLTKEEEVKINNKFELGSRYDNMIDALNDLEDSEEGAGLGIFSMIMILKDLGINKDNFKLFTVDNETHCTTRIAISKI